MSVISSVLHATDDRVNPMVVKEMRQAVQSRLVLAILYLFLAINMFIVCSYLMFNSRLNENPRAGGELFSWLYFALVWTCMSFVPLYTGVRMMMERNHSNIDLVFITTISPAAIIRGKFWAGVAMCGLIYSTCLPFLALTYLLRGIDLPSVFFILGASFLCSWISIMAAVFVGSVASGLFLRMVLAAGLLSVGGSMIGAVCLMGNELALSGLASTFRTSEDWVIPGILLLGGISVLVLLYLLAVAAVSAPTSNRMLPTRVFLTICWVVYGGIALVCSNYYRADEPIFTWVIGSLIVFESMFILILAEREEWSLRTRRRIPRTPPMRFFAWLFYTGSAGGAIWAITLCLLTLGIGRAFAPVVSTWSSNSMEFLSVAAIWLLFVWCYAMTAVFVRRKFFPNCKPMVNILMVLILVILGSTLPLLIAFCLTDPLTYYDDLSLPFVVTNPFLATDDSAPREAVVFCLCGWALLGLLANVTWFQAQWNAFRRYQATAIPQDSVLSESPEPVHA